MPKGPNGQKRPADAIGAAVMVGRIATGEIPDDIKASSGRVRSGKAGGAARAVSLSEFDRVNIAKTAAAVRWNKESVEMEKSAKEKLLSLLFDEGRELVNLKFFPGADAVEEDTFCSAAHRMISRALANEGAGNIPVIDGKQHSIGDLVKA